MAVGSETSYRYKAKSNNSIPDGAPPPAEAVGSAIGSTASVVEGVVVIGLFGGLSIGSGARRVVRGRPLNKRNG